MRPVVGVCVWPDWPGWPGWPALSGSRRLSAALGGQLASQHDARTMRPACCLFWRPLPAARIRAAHARARKFNDTRAPAWGANLAPLRPQSDNGRPCNLMSDCATRPRTMQTNTGRPIVVGWPSNAAVANKKHQPPRRAGAGQRWRDQPSICRYKSSLALAPTGARLGIESMGTGHWSSATGQSRLACRSARLPGGRPVRDRAPTTNPNPASGVQLLQGPPAARAARQPDAPGGPPSSPNGRIATNSTRT